MKPRAISSSVASGQCLPQSIHASGIVVIRVRVYSIVILARYDPPRHLPDQWQLVCEGVDQRQHPSLVISERAHRKPYNGQSGDAG